MPRASKPRAANWTQGLDEDEVHEAFDEACVDAYGEDEQHTALLTALGNELKFPFSAEVLGEKVTVVGMEWPEDDEYGLDLVCERSGQRHRMEARAVQLVRPFPRGHLYLAAYLEWKRTL